MRCYCYRNRLQSTVVAAAAGACDMLQCVLQLRGSVATAVCALQSTAASCDHSSTVYTVPTAMW
jgi:hypothetical protein